jgi:hypothetical protein
MMIKVVQLPPSRRQAERSYRSCSFSTSVQDEVKWSASRPGRSLTPGMDPHCYICHIIAVNIANNIFAMLESIFALYETYLTFPMDPRFKTVAIEVYRPTTGVQRKLRS